MNLWLIVPIKSLSQGKSRLTPSLSAAERRRLSQELLEKTLSVIFSVDEFAGVVVVSRDREALMAAQQAGAVTLTEVDLAHGGHKDSHQTAGPEFYLNGALHQAREHVVARGADAILILPADLPLLTQEELQRLIHRGKAMEQGVVIAPSRNGGTNALLLRPPSAIDFAYGSDSFHRHLEQAHRNNLPTQIVESAALALDLDLPEDLVLWQTMQQG
jgi:2-phospho-L-lactate guanylyltransferase